jgi:hypothetical protein
MPDQQPPDNPPAARAASRAKADSKPVIAKAQRQRQQQQGGQSSGFGPKAFSHDLLDHSLTLLEDLLNATTRFKSNVTTTMRPVVPFVHWQSGPSTPRAHGPVEATITLPSTARGQSSEAHFTLRNPSALVHVEGVLLHCEDLYEPGGERIPGQQAAFTPKTIKLGPGASKQVKVTLRVPGDTNPGHYTGRIHAADSDGTTTTLPVDVEIT